MELEEALAKIKDLSTQVEAVSSKNRELLEEKRQLKAKTEEIDREEYSKGLEALAKIPELESQITSLQENGAKAVTKLEDELNARTTALHEHLLNGGMSEALAKANIRPELLDGAKALLMPQAQLVEEDGKFKTVIGENSLVDAVAEWANSENGKHFVKAPDNSGGGANPKDGSTTPSGDEQRAKKIEAAKQSGDITSYLSASLTA
jgi:hypothetical protein